MSALLGSLLDPERLRDCRDTAIRHAREDTRHRAPFWMFSQRTPAQERIQHPAHHQKPPSPDRRRAGPRHSRFGDLQP